MNRSYFSADDVKSTAATQPVGGRHVKHQRRPGPTARPALVADPPDAGRRPGLRPRGQDVLVDPEDVARVVLALDPGEAVVVAAVRRADAFLGRLLALEVDVPAARRVGPRRLR